MIRRSHIDPSSDRRSFRLLEPGFLEGGKTKDKTITRERRVIPISRKAEAPDYGYHIPVLAWFANGRVRLTPVDVWRKIYPDVRGCHVL